MKKSLVLDMEDTPELNTAREKNEFVDFDVHTITRPDDPPKPPLTRNWTILMTEWWVPPAFAKQEDKGDLVPLWRVIGHTKDMVMVESVDEGTARVSRPLDAKYFHNEPKKFAAYLEHPGKGLGNNLDFLVQGAKMIIFSQRIERDSDGNEQVIRTYGGGNVNDIEMDNYDEESKSSETEPVKVWLEGMLDNLRQVPIVEYKLHEMFDKLQDDYFEQSKKD